MEDCWGLGVCEVGGSSAPPFPFSYCKSSQDTEGEAAILQPEGEKPATEGGGAERRKDQRQ